jgi:hypothetical protein
VSKRKSGWQDIGGSGPAKQVARETNNARQLIEKKTIRDAVDVKSNFSAIFS